MAEPAYDWQVGVFCHNEVDRVGACIAATDAAAVRVGKRALVTVIVNGSTDGSWAEATIAGALATNKVAVCSVRLADKSNAINQFLYQRHVSAAAYFCVDAYAIVEPDALVTLERAMQTHPRALVASGMALNGRTMPAATSVPVESGDVVGCLYALRAEFVNGIRESGVRLPVGLYRGDGLIGSMARHNLDAMGTPGDRARAISVSGAGFRLRSLSMFSRQDLVRQARRKVRQMRGLLENAAIKEIIYRQGYAGLPECADEMIRDYLRRCGPHGVPRVSLVERPFMALALRQVGELNHSKTTPGIPPAT